MVVSYGFNKLLEDVIHRNARSQIVASDRLEKLLVNEEPIRTQSKLVNPLNKKAPTFGVLTTSGIGPNSTITKVADRIDAKVTPPATPAAAAPAVAKKDDKKKSKKKRESKIVQMPKYNSNSSPTSNSESIAPSNNVSGGFPILPPAAAEKKKDPNDPDQISDEEWVNKLVRDYEEVTKLISMFTSGQISSQRYYSLIDKMIATDRKEAKRYALIALSVAQSKDSFERVAQMSSNESDLEISTQIEENLKKFRTEESTSHLIQSLKSTKPVVRYQAALQIYFYSTSETESSAAKGLTARAQRGFASGPNSSKVSLLLSALEEAAQTERLPEVLGQMKNAINQLKSVGAANAELAQAQTR